MATKHDTEWKLPDLADLAGVSPRTVRYYVQRGLLPPPVFRGKDTVYGDEHLTRLKAIRALQDKFLPLDAIQIELERLSGPELAKVASGQGGPPPFVPMVPMPAPKTTATRWVRYELAPGLELHVDEHADAGVRALAEKIKQLSEEE